jgi:hypothetical protein
MVRFVKYFLLIIMLSACNMPKPAPYERYVNEIIRSFAQDMRKEYGLVCIGSGGRMPNDVEQINVYFHIYRHCTIEEARELFVNVTEKFIEKINSHEKIRPFLKEYPITNQNADHIFSWCRAQVCISFQRNNESHYLDGSVAFISQGKGGKIYYSKAELHEVEYNQPRNRIVQEERLVTFFEEAYEDAQRLVAKSQHENNNRTSF